MTTLLAFAFVLGVLVFVHELGHYLVGRWCGFGVYDVAATDEPVHVALVTASSSSASVLDTCYADTADEVKAAELDVVGELAALVESRLSPLEACRALFNPIVEEAPDVA